MKKIYALLVWCLWCVQAHAQTCVVNAGNDTTVCGNQIVYRLGTLSGSVTSFHWTTSGSGVFSPSNTVLNPVYIPSLADAGSAVTLTLKGYTATDSCSDNAVVTQIARPVVNAGADQTICATGNPTLYGLIGTRTGGTGQTWTTNGTGFFSPNATVINPTYHITASDRATGQVAFYMTSTGNGVCPAARDTMILTFQSAPTIDAGANQTVCSNVPSIALSATRMGATGQAWTTSGSGIFSPSNTVLNPTYTPSISDRTLSTIVLRITTTGGACTAAKDSTIVTLQAAPLVDAGANQTVCSSSTSIALNGTRTGGTGQTWTTSGTGFFSNPFVLNPTYSFSAFDKTLPSIVLYLTSTGNGICTAAKDSLVVTFQQAPVVDAGTNQTVCSSAIGLGLLGTRTGGTGQTWTTSGTGAFIPSTTVLTPTYVFSAADKTAGLVVFRLTSTGNGLCTAAKDSIIVTFQTAPFVDAGPDQLVCSTINSIAMNAVRTGATGQLWTTSGTGSFSNNTAIIPAYTFSAADKIAGQVTLTITTTGNGACPPASDSMTATYLPKAIADAGPDQTVCGDGTGVQLNGSIANAPAGHWTYNGSGNFIPSDTTLNAVYLPSPPDLVNGFVLILLTPIGTNCSNEADSMWITFISAPQVSAGPDQTVCLNADSVFLLGGAANITSKQWQTSGSGNFFPNDSSLVTRYYPSAADKALGTVTLFLLGQGNAGCLPDSSSLIVQFIPCQDTCTSQLSFSDSLSGKTLYVDGIVTPGTPGYYNWSFGDGTFLYGQSVSHTYATPGTYLICVDFTSVDSVCHLQYCRYIQVKKCYVAVTFTKHIYEDSVSFSAATTPATPGDYYWDFGDGVIGKGQNVSHVYGQSGTYTVSLSFYSTDNTCVCEAVFTDSVKIKACPKIYFDQSVEGTTIFLTAVSNTPASGTHYWDFGDGTYATGTSVIHTYSTPGTYSVSLDFFSHNGTCQCLCHSEFIKNVKVSNCYLQASFTDSTQQNTVTFQATPSSLSYYYWNFGDGVQQYSSSSVISHTYSNTGTYVVSLTLMDYSNPFDTCVASVTDTVVVSPGFLFKSNYISVYPNPANESIQYSFEEESSILAESVEVLNGMGTVVKKAENVLVEATGNSLELDQLPPGLYVIKITSAGKLFSKQFLKN